MIIVALTLVLLNAAAQQDQASSVLFLAEKFKALQELQLCRAVSPINDFKYGNQKVKEVQGIYFCDQYSKRSCCSADNFNEVKLKLREWFDILLGGSGSTSRRWIYRCNAWRCSRSWCATTATGTSGRGCARDCARSCARSGSTSASTISSSRTRTRRSCGCASR